MHRQRGSLRTCDEQREARTVLSSIKNTEPLGIDEQTVCETRTLKTVRCRQEDLKTI